MVGLEVHQQLLTERKLFCRCPAGLYTDDHDGEILRHMRPTLSELGEYDGTALMEFKTRKNIIYLLNERQRLHLRDGRHAAVPDEPAGAGHRHRAVPDARAATSSTRSTSPASSTSTARIPTGFQRTAIVGVNGQLPFRGREHRRITQVSVEEDSCREVSDTRPPASSSAPTAWACP